MDTGALISLYRRQAGMTIDELVELSGVPKGTLNKIIGGTTKAPTLDTMKAIAKALGKTLADFDDHTAPTKNASFLSSEALQIAKDYSILDAHGKHIVEVVLSAELDRISEENTDHSCAYTQIQRYPYLNKIACAGTSFTFDDIPTDVIDVPPMPGADFVIGVSGTSMDPDFFDGDLLYVRKTTELHFGEVGIFTIGNVCYVKEYGRNGLISHNPNFREIPGTEDIRLVGKVLGKVPKG